jgi:hypothetical protein
MNADAGERHLVRQLRIQRENLQRRDIAGAIIDREVATLDAAIRAALWRAVLTPGQR